MDTKSSIFIVKTFAYNLALLLYNCINLVTYLRAYLILQYCYNKKFTLQL